MAFALPAMSPLQAKQHIPPCWPSNTGNQLANRAYSVSAGTLPAIFGRFSARANTVEAAAFAAILRK
jgi:hypothetical protein